MYELTDIVIENIRKELIRDFSKLKSLLSYDELNVMSATPCGLAEQKRQVKPPLPALTVSTISKVICLYISPVAVLTKS